MSWLTSWYAKGKQVLGRIGETLARPVRSAFDFLRGKPVSTGAATPAPPTGQTLQTPQIQQGIAQYGEVQTPWGTVRIDPDKIKDTIAGKIPQSWIEDVTLEKIRTIERPNIWDRPYHYRIQFRVLELQTDERGNQIARFRDKWVTVVAKSKLSAAEVISRGSEIALSDYSEGSPPIRGAIAAVDTIAPIFYLGANADAGAFTDEAEGAI